MQVGDPIPDLTVTIQTGEQRSLSDLMGEQATVLYFYPKDETPLAEDGTYKANTWQGTFPVRNTVEDGYLYTSPVGAFGETPLGLTDMGGNVWEWTQNWFLPYADRNEPFSPTAQSEKVQRGGSFLCEPGWCHGYRVSARSHSTPETSLFHVGFRCVMDIPEG